METDPRLSLVFVNFRSVERLTLALESLFDKEKERLYEVIVVNNDRLEESPLERLKILHSFTLLSAENDGFGAGANCGARVARGDILGFLNPDVIWQDPFLGRVATALAKAPQSIVGIPLVNQHGKIDPWSAGRAPGLLELCKSNLLPRRAHSDLASADLDWVSGAALFVSREVFQKVGGFDEAFFLYFEDVDFCVRAKKIGVTITRDEQSRLFHHGGTSFATRAQQKEHFRRSQQLYFKKHRSFFEVCCLKGLHRFLRLLGL